MASNNVVFRRTSVLYRGLFFISYSLGKHALIINIYSVELHFISFTELLGFQIIVLLSWI